MKFLMAEIPQLTDLTLEITNACNLRCRCCGIWKERKARSLSLSAIEYIVSVLLKKIKINSVALTGGEPFLHPQVDGIFKFFHILKLKKLVRAIGIYSNGFDHSRIVSFLEKHGDMLKGVSLGISLDGRKAHHDDLRGRPGAFDASMKTVDYVVQRCGGLLKPAIKFTINRRNYGDLFALYLLAKSRGFRFMPKLAEFGAKAYYHRVSSRAAGLDWDDPCVKPEIIRQLRAIALDAKSSGTPAVDVRILSSLERIVRLGMSAITTCRTPGNFLFITCAGAIYPCLYMPPVSSIGTHFLKDIYGPEHQERIRMGLQGRCPRCYAYHGFLKTINLKEV